MNSALPSVSQAIVAIHSRFVVEKVWCQNPVRLLQRFVEAVEAARDGVPPPDRAYFDRRMAGVRAELFCDCEDAQRVFERVRATVKRAA